MVRTVIPPHHQHHEDNDAEDIATDTDTYPHREGKSAEHKPNNYRLKHSETEQRRRSKINERFQILKDLIIPNDQKRDKASLLLEVIEYVQYLQEKLQVYEGSYHQKANHGLVDNYVNHSQAMRNGFLDENTAIQPMTSMQGSVESEYSGEFPHRADHATGSVNAVVPLSIPLQPCPYPPGKGLQLIENLSSHPEPSTAKGFTIVTEDRTFDRGSISVSDVYSQGLHKRLAHSLQTSGVDISHANISVQLDVGKQVRRCSNSVAPSTEMVTIGLQTVSSYQRLWS
ncbi:transcription factor BIM2 isoform X2 [Amaranthus tricolor]|uniref:transcription factor BIM2 isoform X2 n=1 Tax=Amaranthus tricolor TaxID=29722 RepID=UPI0025896898|nr:transcription factor BIM2 isoform X2 [Amaranthus tricolor]